MTYKLAMVTTLALSASMLAACGGGEKGAQTLAQVNGKEITVHQLNGEMANMPELANLPPENAQKIALDKMVGRELLVQKATEVKLDRDPQVMQTIERTNKMILAQAYLDRVTKSIAPPTAAEINDYFTKHPELFSERRVYELQQVLISAKLGKEDILRRLSQSANIKALLDNLKADKIEAHAVSETKSADQLPLDMLPKIAAMKPGSTIVITANQGTLVVHLTSSKPAPLNEAQAKPMIERFLTATKKDAFVEQEVARLGKEGEVEYFGKFAESAQTKAETKAK